VSSTRLPDGESVCYQLSCSAVRKLPG
jgi:hypothetical protein